MTEPNSDQQKNFALLNVSTQLIYLNVQIHSMSNRYIRLIHGKTIFLVFIATFHYISESQLGVTVPPPPRGIWHCLETFFFVMIRGWGANDIRNANKLQTGSSPHNKELSI